jgi:hypothetical protein
MKTSVCFYLYVAWTVEPSNHVGWVVSHSVQCKILASYCVLSTGPSIALRAQTHIRQGRYNSLGSAQRGAQGFSRDLNQPRQSFSCEHMRRTLRVSICRTHHIMLHLVQFVFSTLY